MKRCYLCGATENITRDHIPPEGFFIPPLPDNLITVPCCYSCNDSYKKDDEAARTFFSAYRWQSAKGMWVWKNKVVNSTFKRSPKLKANIRKSLLHVPVQTDQGVEIMPAILFPEDRLNRWLIRITRGLLFKFYPDIDSSDMYFEVDQITPSQELADTMYATMTYDERGNGIFRFWRAVVSDEINCPGMWSYVFYDGMCFSVAHSKDKSDFTI
ncbi:MAG: hypothetical protein ABFD81_04545 [Syntrophaceae bacterium]